MPAISDINLEMVKRLYYKELRSAKQIAKEFNVSIDAVYYFMRRNALKRRSFSEDNRLRFERKMPSFFIKRDLSQYDGALKIMGIVLYWGEGYKSDKASIVDFANSDPYMISVFLNFLRRVCGISENKLTVFLYCYKNQKPDKLVNFWSKLTNISRKQFSKPYIREDFKLAKLNKMPHGLIHIRYNDKKLLLLIKEWIDSYKKIYAQVAKRSNATDCQMAASRGNSRMKISG